jgi:uncharacterized radical SAM superfamily Fe-S cluster-containing enzyme
MTSEPEPFQAECPAVGEEVLLSTTWSVCPECLGTISAERIALGPDVVLRKRCPEHGEFETVIWRGSPSHGSWDRTKIPSHPSSPFTETSEGCPRDCGLCPEHRQHTCTALIEVTGRCDLKCRYCFADGGWTKSDVRSSNCCWQPVPATCNSPGASPPCAKTFRRSSN